ncbi:multidrug transporter [Bifidobacterium lemurum]|uniref:Multidrug transporter n=1 Tax=Bifidobacterium lemurum TaxID=1603886 RepID=A0A261FV50_9BIFI|nr:MFS transporter [Bifidobacterium lemurum]OZG62636.1 multidrug transporter [Bifidobacterium lemurum]QOL34642.1 MFS transporter [Bifidobacterium lemurum]
MNRSVTQQHVEANVGRPSVRFTASLVIGPACWLMPHQGAIATLLPQRVGDIAPADKVPLMMVFSSTAMIVALLSNIVLGACSDRTRSRFGKRRPWIVSCSVLSCLVLLAFARSSTIAGMLVTWCLYELVVNGVAAAMIAQMSDRVPERWRGTASSAYGIGQMAGSQLGVLMSAQFLGDVRLGLDFLAMIALVGGLCAAWLAGEPGNADEPRESLGLRGVLRVLMFPMSNASDFYKVLAGRFAMVIASNMASGYMLYVMQDYLGLDRAGAAALLSLNSALMLVIGLVCCVAAGPVADRLGHTRSLAVATMVVVAVGIIVPFLIPTPVGLVAFACIVGVGQGANSALVQTISLQALPDPSAAAKDLGFLNLANTLGGVCGSLLGAAVIGRFGYAYVFVFGALCALASAVCFRTVRCGA